MPLTPEEQAELDSLQKMSPSTQQVGLTPDEQSELDSLQSMAPVGQGVIEMEETGVQESTQIPMPTPTDVEFQSLSRGEIQANEMTDFGLLHGYAKTKGERNVKRLWESSNPIDDFSGQRGPNRAIHGELQRRGFSNDFIQYALPQDQLTMGESLSNVAGDVALPAIASTATLAATKNPKLAAGAAALGGGLTELIKEGATRYSDPASARTAGELSVDVPVRMLWEGGTDLVAGKLGEVAGKALFAPAGDDILRSGARASNELEESYKIAAKTMSPQDVPLRSGSMARQGLGAKVARPTPGQVTKSRLGHFLDSVLENTIGGHPVNQVKNEMLPVAVKQMATKYGDEFSDGMLTALKNGDIDTRGIADLISDEISGSKKAWRALETRYHSAVAGELSKQGLDGVPIVDMSGTRRMAQSMADKVKRGASAGLGPESDSYIAAIAKNPNTKMDYMDAKNLSQELAAKSRQLGKANDNNAKRIVDGLKKGVDDAMDTAASQYGPGVATAHKKARRLSAYGNELYQKRVVQNMDKLIDFNDASKQVVTGMLRQEGQLDTIFNILDDVTGKTPAQISRNAGTKKKIANAYVAEAMASSLDEDGQLIASQFQKKFNSLSQKQLNRMYTKEMQENVKFLIDTTRLAGKSDVGGLFGIIVRGAQISTAVGAAASGEPELAVAALTAPYLVARFVTSHAGNKLLSEGYQTLASGGRPAASYAGRVMSALYRNKKDNDKDEARHMALIESDQLQKDFVAKRNRWQHKAK